MTRKAVGWLAVVAMVSASSVAFAHMALSKSMPAANAVVSTRPATIQIWFTQAPDKAVSRLTLIGPSGEVKLGALTAAADKSIAAPVEGGTPDGAYKVAWQAAGDDGHVQKGEFAFSVRQSR